MPKREDDPRTKLRDRVVEDCLHMAPFREHRRPKDGERWTARRMLDAMIRTFEENHRDDPDGGWDSWLDVAHEVRAKPSLLGAP